MSVLNAALARLVDGLLYPFEDLPPLAGLACVSLVAAVVMLLTVRATSDQARIRAVRRAIEACVFEVRLFGHDARAMLRAVGEMVWHNVTYLRLSLVPVLWMAVPLGLLVAQLHFHYAYGGLEVGQPATLKARAPSAFGDATPVLTAPPGIRIETPAVVIPSLREAAWRIVAERPGDYVVTVEVGGEAFTKALRVSDAVVRRSPRRPDAGVLGQLLDPAEPPLPAGASVESIAVTYPRRDVRVLGWDVPWLAVFFVLSMTFAWTLRRRFGVVL